MSLRRLAGLWSAELRTGEDAANIGVLVFHPRKVFGDFYEEGRILGGDRGYAFAGTYEIENHSLRARLTITRYGTSETTPLLPEAGSVTLSATLEPGVAREVLELALGGAAGGALRLRVTRRESA